MREEKDENKSSDDDAKNWSEIQWIVLSCNPSQDSFFSQLLYQCMHDGYDHFFLCAMIELCT